MHLNTPTNMHLNTPTNMHLLPSSQPTPPSAPSFKQRRTTQRRKFPTVVPHLTSTHLPTSPTPTLQEGAVKMQGAVKNKEPGDSESRHRPHLSEVR